MCGQKIKAEASAEMDEEQSVVPEKKTDPKP